VRVRVHLCAYVRACTAVLVYRGARLGAAPCKHSCNTAVNALTHPPTPTFGR